MSGIGRAAEAVSAEVDAADALHQKFDHSHLDASSSQEKVSDRKADTSSEEYDDLGDIPDGCTLPTEEEKNTLRRVSAPLPYAAFLIVIVELAERYTFYGASLGPFQNYIQNPLPDGSTAGNVPAGSSSDDVPGALGKHQQVATALTTFFSFFCYITPLLGAYIADTYLGRYKTICLFTGVYIAGLAILVGTSTPAGIAAGAGFPGIVVAMLVIGLGTGGIKANVSAIVVDQVSLKRQVVKTLKPKKDEEFGERVIVDPNVTIGRVYGIFYGAINVGSIAGTLTTTQAEKHVGFWLAFTLPFLVFMLVPLVLAYGRKKYVVVPPQGTVILQAFRVCWMVAADGIKGLLGRGEKSGWNVALPDNVIARRGEVPSWLAWDATFVAEVQRTISACKVFVFFPLYWLAYNQMSNNLVSQAGVLRLGSAPNDIFSVFDAFAIVLVLPLLDKFIYPFLRAKKINFKPVARIYAGFLCASFAMIYSAVLQYYIYKASPCRHHGRQNDYPDGECPSVLSISVWVQVPAYFLIGVSECFASVAGLEYAYNKAPASMKSFVQAIYLLTTAVANALNFALVPVSRDPYLIGNYAGIAVAAFIGGSVMYCLLRKQDHTEEDDNEIGKVRPVKESLPGYETVMKE